MQRYFIIFSYDGTNFKGYQKQIKERTVQGELEKALKEINDNKNNVDFMINDLLGANYFE